MTEDSAPDRSQEPGQGNRRGGTSLEKTSRWEPDVSQRDFIQEAVTHVIDIYRNQAFVYGRFFR